MITTFPSPSLETATWIDLLSPTAQEIERVHAVTGLRVPTQAQISEIESTSRLAFDKGAYYLSTPLISRRENGEHSLLPLGLVVSSRILITVRFGSLGAIEDASGQSSTWTKQTADEAFLRVLEIVVDRSADALEHCGAECDDLARSAFRNAAGRRVVSGDLQATLHRLGSVASKVSLVRDGLLGVGRIGAYLMESDFEGAVKLSAPRLKAIRADVASLTDYQSHLSAKIQLLLDATLGFINIEQNEIVKTLTIASVVGIPPVLVAGIYGMNFRFMPELGWRFGYVWALGLIVVSALVPLLWFKRRGWM